MLKTHFFTYKNSTSNVNKIWYKNDKTTFIMFENFIFDVFKTKILFLKVCNINVLNAKKLTQKTSNNPLTNFHQRVPDETHR